MHTLTAASQPASLRRGDMGEALSNRNSMGGRTGAFAGSVTLLVGRLFVLLDVVIDQPAGKARGRPGNCTKCSVATNCAQHSATRCANGGSRQRTLLSLIHIGTAGQGQATGEQGDGGLHGHL